MSAIPYFWTQTRWSVDEQNVTGLASDNNLGCGSSSDTVPLLTMAELYRRIDGATLTAIVTVRILSDVTSDESGETYGFRTPSNTGVFLAFVGVPTVLRSGTLTAAAAASGNTPGMVEDTSIPASWAASGYVSSSAGGRMIRTGPNGKHGWIIKDIGSSRARVNYSTNTTETPSAALPGLTITPFVAGDPYEICSLPKFTHMRIGGGAVRYYLLDFAGSASQPVNVVARGDRGFYAVLCFNRIAVDNKGRGLSRYIQCGFAGNVATGGSAGGGTDGVQYFQCAFVGTGAKVLTFANSRGQMDGSFNTFQGFVVQLYNSSIARSGDYQFFDCTAPLLSLDALSTIELEGLRGADNTNLIVNMPNGGNKIVIHAASTAAAITAATTHPTPFVIGPNSKTLADLPFYAPALDVGIYGA